MLACQSTADVMGKLKPYYDKMVIEAYNKRSTDMVDPYQGDQVRIPDQEGKWSIRGTVREQVTP